MILRSACALAFLLIASGGAMGGSAEDWEAILALDAGPGTKITSREQARQAAIDHLRRQEAALQAFLSSYPSDPKAVDAQLRMARVLMVKGDLSDDETLVARAFVTLDGLVKNPATPPERRADIAFARLSLEMSRAQRAVASARDRLVKQAETFRTAFPGDRRIAPLYAELAGAFDDRPATKRKLLEIAEANAGTDAIRLQIADDLKRLQALNQPVNLEFRSLQDKDVNVRNLRGRVIVICFFADWSPPSLEALERVKEASRKFEPSQLAVLGISLDTSPGTAKEVAAKFGVDWALFCDGKGWESPLVRSLGINALPTVWILDRHGRLRVLNEAEDPGTPIRKLINER